LAITEESRFQLHQRLNDVLGEEHATTLMEHLPPIGWADVATKRDLDQLSVLLKKDLDAVRAELHNEMTWVRSEFALVRQEMSGEFKNVRTEMGALGDRLEKQIADRASQLHRDINRMTLFLMGGLGVVMTGFGLIIR
jgi:hypothetical protein